VGTEAVKVGVIGFGTVGSGTVKVMLGNRDLLRWRLGFDVELKHVADKDTESDRGVVLPGGMLVADAAAVLDDPEIDIVVELIGGMETAREMILRALRKGKHVVTANKAVLAVHGNEIFAEAAEHGVQVGFEASVAGGIPIIKVVREGLVANNVSSIYGIINGTANYIMTKMTGEGAEFEAVLAEAQRLGYAEADPTFDIEGVDAAHKLAILASLAYGIPLSYDEVYTEGITKVSSLDIEFAGELGYKVKVYVRGDAVGETMYYGRGAGDMPTASAVVADVAEIAQGIRGGGSTPMFRVSDAPMKIRKIDDIRSKYYFRFSALDRPGVLSRISGIFGENNISIASVIQKERKAGEAVPLVILTHTATERDIRRAVEEIDRLDVVSAATRYIRVEGEE
jgi:homoserine dehydrogenase